MATVLYNRKTGLALGKEQQQSGLSIAEFARQKNIPKHIVNYWTRLFRKLHQPMESGSTEFVELPSFTHRPGGNNMSKPGTCIVRFPNGISLELSNDTRIEEIFRMVVRL